MKIRDDSQVHIQLCFFTS